MALVALQCVLLCQQSDSKGSVGEENYVEFGLPIIDSTLVEELNGSTAKSKDMSLLATNTYPSTTLSKASVNDTRGDTPSDIQPLLHLKDSGLTVKSKALEDNESLPEVQNSYSSSEYDSYEELSYLDSTSYDETERGTISELQAAHETASKPETNTSQLKRGDILTQVNVQPLFTNHSNTTIPELGNKDERTDTDLFDDFGDGEHHVDGSSPKIKLKSAVLASNHDVSNNTINNISNVTSDFKISKDSPPVDTKHGINQTMHFTESAALPGNEGDFRRDNEDNISVNILHDYLKSKGRKSDGNECGLPAVRNDCRNYYPKFYFSTKLNKCQYHIYYDCEDQNLKKSFETAAECYRHCAPEKDFREDDDPLQPPEDKVYMFWNDGTLVYEINEVTSNDSVSVSFDLRTYSSNADLVAIIVNSLENESVLQIYFRIKQGRFGFQLLSDTEKEDSYFFDIGGIQDGAWHHYKMRLNLPEETVFIQLDSRKGNTSFTNSVELNDIFSGLNPVSIYIGGLPQSRTPNSTRALHQDALRGCVRNVVVSSSKTGSPKFSILGTLIESSHCHNRCDDVDSRSTDALSSICTDKFRENVDLSSGGNGEIVTLSGHDYVSYRLYSWRGRLHTFSNSFLFSFKTTQSDAIVLYATGENKESTKTTQFISVSLIDSRGLLIEANLGGDTLVAEYGKNVSDDQWHTVTIIHENDRLFTVLDDSESHTLQISTEDGNNFFYLDPYLYIGGVPSLSKDCALRPDSGNFEGIDCNNDFARQFYDVAQGGCSNFTYTGCGGNMNNFADPASCLAECHKPGLHSYNNFVGCLRNIYYNDINILNEAERSNIRYVGEFRHIPIGKSCKMPDASVSFMTEDSHLKIQRESDSSYEFRLEIVYKRRTDYAVLASGYVGFLEFSYQWELRISSNEVSFLVPVDFVHLTAKVYDSAESWQRIELRSTGQNVSLSTQEQLSVTALEAPILFRKEIKIGIGVTGEVPGFQGCVLNDINLDGKKINLHSLVGSSLATDDIFEDGCQMGSFCDWSSTCGSSIPCYVVNGVPVCNCDQSSFEGFHCQIGKYRRSCQEYRMLGFQKSNDFIIDMDSDGPMPPAHVYCQFDANGITSTVIAHNVPDNYVIRKIELPSFRIKIKYRDFDEEMLRYLAEDSFECSQDVEFSCIDAPLLLARDTWFSSPWQRKIRSLGSDRLGSCPCKELGNCQDNAVSCNCDIANGWNYKDTARITKKEHIPLTSLTVVQPDRFIRNTAQSKFTLGKLICKSKSALEQSLTLTSPESYFTLPAWRSGDLIFSFRTTSTNASIFYQAYSDKTPTFRITLTSKNTVEFVYSFMQDETRTVFHTDYSISEGKWNLVWIDTVGNQFRIVFNEQKTIMEIPKQQDISLFDGTATIGFISHPIFREYEQLSLKGNGFTGCIKNLKFNGIEVDVKNIFRYSSVSQISFGCTAACDSNPCQNGGTCTELWDGYSCLCKNPYADLGKNCETNINENSITFTTTDSEVVYNNGTTMNNDCNPLRDNFTFNFRTSQAQAILFLAKDYIQNLMQIYVNNSNQVVLLFNYGHILIELSATTKDIALNEGQSVQIVVNRFNTSTSLTVHTRERNFIATVEYGISLLTEKEYQQYPYEVLPHLIEYQHSFTLPGQYFLMFVGGVQSSGISTDLPGLIGCFRGLKIGHKIFDLADPFDWNLGADVQTGCTTICEEERDYCKNGGECVYDFQSDAARHCNCRGTSYIGTVCNEEMSYNFNGRDAVALENWTLTYSEYFAIDFAFSSEANVDEPQLILLVTVLNKRYDTLGKVSYMLNTKRTLSTEVWLDGKRHLSEFSLTDENKQQRRHHVNTVFKENQISTLIDKNRVDVLTEYVAVEPRQSVIHPALLIGGQVNDLPDDYEINANFQGCISNIHFIGEDSEFWPLNEYSIGAEFLVKGLPKQGKCPSFPVTQRSGPVFYESVEVSAWQYPEPQMELVTITSDGAVITAENTSSLDSISTTTAEQPDESQAAKIWPWALIGCLSAFALVIIVVCCCRKCRRRSQPDAEAPKMNAQPLYDPPSYSLHPQRTEDVPLLEREPSARRGNHNINKPSTTTASKIPPWTSNIPDESVPLKSFYPEDTGKEQMEEKQETPNKPQNHSSLEKLNSVDKETTSHIPFRNQLSSDANAIRHIDSSVEGSSDENFEDSVEKLDNLTPEDFNTQRKESIVDPELLRIKLDKLKLTAPIANTESSSSHSSRHSNNSLETLPHNSDAVRDEITKNNLNDFTSTDKTHAEKGENTKGMEHSLPILKDKVVNASDYPNDQVIDLKKYYLKRKASEPPVLPPRSK